MKRWRRFRARLKSYLRGDFGLRPRSYQPLTAMTIHVNRPVLA